jgi:hypothetical protein
MFENHQEDRIVKSIDDLKKVVEQDKNLDTLIDSVSELSRKFSENTEEVRRLSSLIQQEKKDKNIERPFEMLFIPSRGLFYPSKENYLLLNQLTYIEENLLTSEFLVESGKAMQFVLKNILVEQNVRPEELLTGDVQAISLFLRSFAYGDNIDLELDCHHCKFKEEVGIRLSSFQMKDLIVAPEDGLIPMLLDGSDLIFMFKPLTYFEEVGMTKAKLSGLDKIIYMTHSINGCEDKEIISRIYRNMKIPEIHRIKKFLAKAIPGVDANIKHQCSSCGKSNTYNFGGVHGFLSFPPSFRKNIEEECFLVSYYGKGITLEHAKKMSVTERRWLLNRINEELTKKREAEEKAHKQAKAKSKMKGGR